MNQSQYIKVQLNQERIRKECCYGMGGLPSTVTNESIFRIPVLTKISCRVPEKKKKHGSSQA